MFLHCTVASSLNAFSTCLVYPSLLLHNTHMTFTQLITNALINEIQQSGDTTLPTIIACNMQLIAMHNKSKTTALNETTIHLTLGNCTVKFTSYSSRY